VLGVEAEIGVADPYSRGLHTDTASLVLHCCLHAKRTVTGYKVLPNLALLTELLRMV
jgi:hypothetical protein